MKYILILLAIVSLVACKKQCYECTTKATNIAYQGMDTYSTETICGIENQRKWLKDHPNRTEGNFHFTNYCE